MKKSLMAVIGLAVFAAACNSDATSPNTTTNTNTDTSLVTVFIQNNTYSPNPLTVTLGQSVNFKNNDNVEHNAISTSGPVTINVTTIAAMSAQGAPTVMSARGTINYKCTLHGETGVIIVQ